MIGEYTLPDIDAASEHWTARFSRPIIFVILTLIACGVYLAFTIPVAVFPNTDFPRIVVGVDNGVAPINQMQVTVTRPIEEAMNSVPGLERGPFHHQPRLGRSQPVLQLERGHVPDAAVRERRARARAAHAASHRETHRESSDVCRGIARFSATA